MRDEWVASKLLTQRSMLIATTLGLILFVLLSASDSVLGSETLKEALLGMVSAVLGVAVVGLLWETTVRKAFVSELDDKFSTLIAEATRNSLGNAAVRREGLIDLTQDFHHAIPFRDYLHTATQVDIAWWAGRAWFRSHLAELADAVDRGAVVRILLPDVDQAVVLEQMARDSGRPKRRLYEATIEAVEFLGSVDGLSFRFSSVVPRQMYMRLGTVTVFCPYSLSPGLNDRRPNVVIDSDSSIGASMASDFEHAWDRSS